MLSTPKYGPSSALVQNAFGIKSVKAVVGRNINAY
jgi:hypothetical protein